MKITNMKLADIYPYDKNPRFNDEAVEAVANSIKEFGWRSPKIGRASCRERVSSPV